MFRRTYVQVVIFALTISLASALTLDLGVYTLVKRSCSDVMRGVYRELVREKADLFDGLVRKVRSALVSYEGDELRRLKASLPEVEGLALLNESGEVASGIGMTSVPTGVLRRLPEEGVYAGKEGVYIWSRAGEGFLVAKLSGDEVSDLLELSGGRVFLVSGEGSFPPNAPPEIDIDELRRGALSLRSEGEAFVVGEWMSRHGIGIVGEVEADRLMKPMSDVRLGIAAISIAIGIFMIGGTVLFSMWITSPLKKVIEAAKRAER
ncbi:hypothetical protein DRP77_01570 [Candidatus Poribacteria bacterium]|nr:MAG: hypothetical protein DRP77_01570 [Candidatus Poribacteria bacterium]